MWQHTLGGRGSSDWEILKMAVCEKNQGGAIHLRWSISFADRWPQAYFHAMFLRRTGKDPCLQLWRAITSQHRQFLVGWSDPV